MINEYANDYLEDEPLDASVEESNPLDQNAEVQEEFEELCELLEGVIPDDLFNVIKNVRPIEAAVYVLYQLGGRIRMNQPEVDLTAPYEYPEELNELNEKIGDFTFVIAPTPFFALGAALKPDINVDEEVMQACNLEGYIPIIIDNNGITKRVGLVNYKDRVLELTVDYGFSLNIDMPDDATAQEEAIETILDRLAEDLDGLKESMSKEPPKLFDSAEEEQAISEWCHKHSYTILGAIRNSIDIYH